MVQDLLYRLALHNRCDHSQITAAAAAVKVGAIKAGFAEVILTKVAKGSKASKAMKGKKLLRKQ
jgi:hypothetical protein